MGLPSLSVSGKRMNEEQKAALLRYEELKNLVKEAEAEMADLKPTLLEVIPEGTKVNASLGYFELKKRDNWKFSPEIELQEKALKETKDAAIAKGEATSTPTYYVEYRKGKPKQDLSEE